jgi:hypothetical protein
MKKNWKRSGRTVYTNGEKTVVYTNPKYPNLEIQSRKQNIPHANGEGTWSHTSYVLVRGFEELTFHSLTDAIDWVEGTRVPEVWG